ncbi:O-antigen ligase family protein [Pedobacter sp. PLR]|uniref:O-antigen ligase family protein n=1 Tax=Pedobacter sp. PLR TaxID=2994465 RepID=UPI0022459D95|nr:O-antigen ligase family protein [Pedobacter sp. PLR]MCX2449916.1 O-antigen ligase family protein [Pedobacter sp. PLR]
MKLIKLAILLLIFCNLPSYALIHFDGGVGSMLSYSIFLLIIGYYLLGEKEKPIIPFLVFGVLFSFISLMVSSQFSDTFLVTFIKYFIFIIMAPSVIRDVKGIDIYCILLIGSLSILYEAAFVIGIGGRYSGFYLNPNLAGCACILGYAVGLSIEQKKIRFVGQLLFSIAGLVTFSRTFLLIWVLINLLSLFISYKNIYRMLACVALFAVFLSFGNKLDLNLKRLNAFSEILDGKIDNDLKEGSRTETWALYYDKIIDHPIWGNGYHSFSGQSAGVETNRFVVKLGVHNTFLMIAGEAGIFVLLYFLWIYGYILVNGLHFFKKNPSIFFLSFSLVLFMLTTHNYFDNYLVLFTSLWLYHQTYKLRSASTSKVDVLFSPLRNEAVPEDNKLVGQYKLN